MDHSKTANGTRRTAAFLTAVFMALLTLAASHPAAAGESIENSRLGYSAYFPASSPSAASPAVLIVFPGYGLRASHAVNDWAFSAEQNGWATVSVDMDYDDIRRMGDVERRVESVLEDIQKTRPVDSRRVLIAGTAAGGMLAISLGLAYPERYAAVAVAGGGALRSVDWAGLANARKQVFFMIHGAKNQYVPLSEFNATVKSLKDYGARVQSEVFPESDHLLPSHAYAALVADLAGELRTSE